MGLKRKKTPDPDPEPDDSLQEARSLQLLALKKPPDLLLEKTSHQIEKILGRMPIV